VPSRDRRACRAPNRILAAALIAALAVGCAPDADDVAPATDAGATASVTAAIDGPDLLLVTDDGDSRVVASVEGAELLHAEVRPGVDEPLTVLALTREEGRYELRYLAVEDGTPTDLYWFPSRLQVSPDSASIVDVPTLPVWAPDGSGVAWIEWDEDGAQLRTVGWYDHDLGTNPSDEQATYALDGVPPGTQLESWETDADGVTELVTRTEDGERWRIRVASDAASVALEPGTDL
jgi:hypothetical protein